MRLWLAIRDSEGGWKLPFWDSNEKKRGGIQVDSRRWQRLMRIKWGFARNITVLTKNCLLYPLFLGEVEIETEKKMRSAVL